MPTLIMSLCLPLGFALALALPSVTHAEDEGAVASGPFFESEVHRLVIRHCQICHEAASNPMTGFPLRGEAAADYALLRGLVEEGAGDAATLLALTRGEGHLGGPVLARDSDGYALLRAWIEAGMPFATDP